MAANNENCIKLLIDCLQNESYKIDAIREISQLILVFMQINYVLTKEEILADEGFEQFDEFVKELCIEANNSNTLVTEKTSLWIPTILGIFETLKRLDEFHHLDPIIARISLPFFLVIHSIRVNNTQLLVKPNPTYDRGRILNTICNTLFAFVTNGVSEVCLHNHITTKILPVIEQDFEILYASDPRCLHFYSTVFSVKNQKTCSASIGSITNLLNKSSTELKTKILTFLDSDEMEYFFPTFASLSGKRLPLKTFKLLDSFIALTNNIDMWSTEKIRSMSTKVFDKTSSEIRKTAALNYINILNKKGLTDKEILQEILEFFLISKKIDMLSTYIETFWNIWPSIRKFDYLFIIFDEEFQEICYVCVSNFIVAVCKRLIQQIDLYKDEVIHLLEILCLKLMDILKLSVLSCEILMECFEVIPKSLLRSVTPEVKETLISVLYKTMEDERIIKVALFYVTHLLTTLNMSTLNLLKMIENNQKEFVNAHNIWTTSKIFEITDTRIKKLREKLIKLAALSNYIPFRPTSELLNILKIDVVELRRYKKFVPQNCEMEGYAFELYSNCLQVTLLNILREEDEQPEFLVEVQSFLDILIKYVDIEKMEMDIFSASKCLSALFNIYSILQPKNSYVPNSVLNTMVVELNAQVYGILIYAAVYYVFKAPKALLIKPSQIKNVQYQRDILRRVIVFHSHHFLIPTFGVWKILIYYGDTLYFNKELDELLRVLYNYAVPPNDHLRQRFNRVLPIVIFNLKKNENYPRNFIKKLKEFLNFITSEAKEDSNIIKISLLLELLEMHLSVLPIIQIDNKKNRLDMLPMLEILLPSKVDLLVYRQIESLIKKIRGNFLTTNEQHTLHKFKNLLKK